MRCAGKIATVALATVLQACVPMRWTGYKPDGPGVLGEPPCMIGAREELVITPHAGVALYIHAWKGHGNRIEMLSRMKIADGMVVRFASNEFIARSRDWPNAVHLTMIASLLAPPRPRAYHLTDELPGSAYEFSLAWSGERQPYETPLPETDGFSLEIPALEINGKEQAIGPLTFKAYDTTVIHTCS